MTLKDLEYLVAAAEAGTMRGAAQRCGVSQPTLSAQLAKLEAELDCLLFERGRQGVRLTEAGVGAVAHARTVLDAANALRRACQASSEPLAGPFRLGLIPTVGPYVMPALLPRIRRSYPRTELYLREEVTRDLLRRMRQGELDAAIVSRPVDEPTLHLEDIGVEPFHAVVPADHVLASRRSVGLADLRQHRMLLLEDGHCLREQTASLCGIRQQTLTHQASSVESLRQMVAAGIGVTLLPDLAVRGRFAQTAGVRVVPLARPTPSRTLALAFRRTHPEFGALRQLAQQMSAWLKEALTGGPAA